MRMALYQPDIPQNAGALMRTAACLGLACDVIGPAGFVMTDRKLRRAGMDYLDRLELAEHASWERFLAARRAAGGRLVLLTVKGGLRHLDFAFEKTDVLLVGSESRGVPDAVAGACDAGVRVPIVAGARSLNVAQALAIVLGEALRQTNGFPGGKNG